MNIPEGQWMLINSTHSVMRYMQMYIIMYPDGPMPLGVYDKVFDGNFYGYYRDLSEAKDAINNHHTYNIQHGEVFK